MANENSAARETKKGKGSLFYIITVFLAVLLFLMLLCGLAYLAVKNNIYGVAEKYNSQLSRIPVFSDLLPDVEETDPDAFLTEDEVRKRYKELRKEYNTLKTENERLTEEYRLLQVANEQNIVKIATLEAEKDAFEKQKQKLKEDKEEFARQVANKDKSGFKSYYESIDAQAAERIYREIVQQEKSDDDKKQLAKLYEEMKPAAVAAIFEEMGEEKIVIITEILNAMERSAAASVMQEFSPEFASLVTGKLAEIYMGN